MQTLWDFLHNILSIVHSAGINNRLIPYKDSRKREVSIIISLFKVKTLVVRRHQKPDIAILIIYKYSRTRIIRIGFIRISVYSGQNY